jgi:hypothetical protein
MQLVIPQVGNNLSIAIDRVETAHVIGEWQHPVLNRDFPCLRIIVNSFVDVATNKI